MVKSYAVLEIYGVGKLVLAFRVQFERGAKLNGNEPFELKLTWLFPPSFFIVNSSPLLTFFRNTVYLAHSSDSGIEGRALMWYPRCNSQARQSSGILPAKMTSEAIKETLGPHTRWLGDGQPAFPHDQTSKADRNRRELFSRNIAGCLVSSLLIFKENKANKP